MEQNLLKMGLDIILNKVIELHETYGISIDQICSDMKCKLLDMDKYGEFNYPYIIHGLEQYSPASSLEAEAKSALLKYLCR